MNRKIANIICFGLPLPMLVISLFIGSSAQVNVFDYLPLLYKKLADGIMNVDEAAQYEMISNILFNVRMPRILLTFLVGAALSTSGGVLQGIFRNPLVDSYILGISSGAAFGASLAIVYSLSFVNVYAFVGGSIAVVLTYMIAGSHKQISTVSIILSGMIISGVFMALLTMVQYISNPYKLQAIVQWAMGNLHAASWIELKQAFLPILICLIIVFVYRWRINLLALGDDAAKSVGVNPAFDKLILIICATLMTTTTVAVAGIISFYGLFLPHIVRMLLGSDNSKSIPGNIFLGGSFLLLIDNLSRALFVFEVPIGIFTTILGGAFFVFLMRKNKLNWN
ncbi:iron complex transport system permease protein [Dysgonomonas alginatilytica]|uniref:Iron complex transport system permease protein n=1 Tax=Dysgonomonas alginatilytica TaxID=1605892 RepID=A0A2V3PSH0_9BACT|nr:iron ABC transporter permease [Dysgonomonas alginatilytica]PXV66353.1 iron complex transport system permease protein [Dysgonomonas alginatilytica]